jgi:hypothetical protein
MEEFMEDICKRVKKIRQENFMTQVEFAKSLGVTNAHISKIEKGGTVPSEALIKLISKEYRLNENWLKSGEEPEFLEDLELLADDKSSDFIDILNNNHRDNSPTTDILMTDIEIIFANICNVSGLDENIKLQYLNILKEMAEIIDKNNRFIKSVLKSKQMSLKELNTEELKNYKLKVNKAIDAFINMLKPYKIN